MSKKVTGINPEQGSLLQISAGAVIAAESFPPDPHEKRYGIAEPSTSFGPEGSFVAIADRAAELIAALEAFGKRNQRLGFDAASNTRQYNGPIWEKYRGKTPSVQKGAQNNSEIFLDQAKLHFWRATGFSAMRSAGIIPKEESDAQARKMWRQFADQYGGSAQRAERDAYKANLKKSVTASRRILRRAAKNN